MRPGETAQIGKGESMTCLRSGADDGGRFEFELVLDAGVEGPPVHHHPDLEEFECLEGEMIFVVDGHERVLRAGERIAIPAGTPHTFRAGKGGRMRGLGANGVRFERACDQLAAGGPAFTRLALYLSTVDPGASYMVHPVVRATLRVIGWIGRLRGVRIIEPCRPAANARMTSSSSSP